MRVPVKLVDFFKTDFEPLVSEFLKQNSLIEDASDLHNKRFLNRSVAPHVKALSELFNRVEGKQTDGIDTETYWSEAGNQKNRRLAYFLGFMPGNLFRVASVWSELQRLGFKWPFPATQDFKGIEWGAGTAAGASGIIAAEKAAPLGLPARGNFALIEQSKAALNLGTTWFDFFGRDQNMSARPFHRRVDLSKTWLPPSAPKFHLFVMSYFLNESDIQKETLVDAFLNAYEAHLEDEGLVVIVEPALKLQSRKLLEFRKTLLAHPRVVSGELPLRLLLPCLGHQACGALAKDDDWCHEEVSWWRPPYLRELDALTGLDRKSLPFSYLVIQKTKKELMEILPELKGKTDERYRLVSPAHALSRKTVEFFICGQDGKRRARLAVPDSKDDEVTPDRGTILQDAKLHGEPALSQLETAKLLK